MICVDKINFLYCTDKLLNHLQYATFVFVSTIQPNDLCVPLYTLAIVNHPAHGVSVMGESVQLIC